MKMLPVESQYGGRRKQDAIELDNQTGTDPNDIGTLSRGAAGRQKMIPDEFVEVTGFHRKHAIRVLGKGAGEWLSRAGGRRVRIYDEAVRQALTILWETADRVCGKRLKPAIPALLEAMGTARSPKT